MKISDYINGLRHLLLTDGNIVDEVLGKDYYTINPDHFGGDNESSEDIINKYRHIKKELKISKINNIILLLVVFILGYFIIILN